MRRSGGKGACRDKIPVSDLTGAEQALIKSGVWDALRSDRLYRSSWNVEKVREHLRSLAGTHFDPRVVKMCLDSDILMD